MSFERLVILISTFFVSVKCIFIVFAICANFVQNIVDVDFSDNNIFDFPTECCIQIEPNMIKTIGYLI